MNIMSASGHDCSTEEWVWWVAGRRAVVGNPLATAACGPTKCVPYDSPASAVEAAAAAAAAVVGAARRVRLIALPAFLPPLTGAPASAEPGAALGPRLPRLTRRIDASDAARTSMLPSTMRRMGAGAAAGAAAVAAAGRVNTTGSKARSQLHVVGVVRMYGEMVG